MESFETIREKRVERVMNQGLKDFYFFSDFLNRKVYAPSGRKVGKIVDLIAERAEPYPKLIGFVVRGGGKEKTLFS